MENREGKPFPRRFSASDIQSLRKMAQAMKGENIAREQRRHLNRYDNGRLVENVRSAGNSHRR